MHSFNFFALINYDVMGEFPVGLQNTSRMPAILPCKRGNNTIVKNIHILNKIIYYNAAFCLNS